EKYTAAVRLLEREMAQRADLVVYPSRHLHSYVTELGAERSLYFPNGVDFHHYASRRLPPPPEYSRLTGPIPVHLCVLPSRFHFAWIRAAGSRLPQLSFVLVGPDTLARKECRGVKNVHLLGFRDHALVPAYLQHAHVGLVPFDPNRNPRGVEVLNPQ